MRITFHISTKCNLRCTYCYQKNKSSALLSLEDAKAFLDDLFIFRLSNTGKIFKYIVANRELLFSDAIVLDFFGGECTLFIDLMDQICTYFEEQCKKYEFDDWLTTYKVGITSNGTTYEYFPKVKAFYQKYKSRIIAQVSIDGCKACHDAARLDVNGNGTYDRAEQAVIEQTKVLGYVPRTKLTFCKQNMQYIKDSVANLALLGYTKAEHDFDKTSDDAELTLEESEQYYKYLVEALDYIIDNKINLEFGPICYLEKLANSTQFSPPSCGSFGHFVVINWEGNIYSCAQLSESYLRDKKKELCLGNIRDGITNLEALDLLRGKHGNTVPFPCVDCPFINLCEPCPARNILRTGRPNNYVFSCSASLPEIRAMFYFIDRALATDYPYFRENIEAVHKIFPNGLPEREYLLYSSWGKEK